MSIDTGRNGYNSVAEFQQRVKPALEGHEILTERDLTPYAAGGPVDRWIRGLPIHGDVLDFGCGFGRLAPLLETTFGDYFGVDPVKEKIEYANRTYRTPRRSFATIQGFDWSIVRWPGNSGTYPRVQFTRSDKDAAPLWKFDTAVSVTVMQHLTLADACAALRNIRRHMRLGGTLWLWEAEIFEESREWCEDRYHQRPEHMIPKLQAELQDAAQFGWKRLGGIHFQLTAI